MIEYLSNKIELQSHIINNSKDLDPLKYVELCLDSGIKNGTSGDEPYFIVLDNNLSLIVIYKTMF